MDYRFCLYCNNAFVPKAPHHLFCDIVHQVQYNKGKTWRSYFRTLIRNNAKERKELDTDFLIELFEGQGRKCAISGVELTKVVGRGKVATNASIDRIQPGAGYTPENVRIVCNFINGFRSNVSDEEFVWWCKKVVEANG